jgi:hypothetical protein
MQDDLLRSRANVAVLVAEIRPVLLTGGRPDAAALGAVSEQARFAEERIRTGRGAVVKRIGGSILGAFDNVERAVEAAVGIQEGVAGLVGQAVSVQIGICCGSMTVDGGDVLSDALNAVSALAAIAGPGEIFLSGQAKDALPSDLQNRTRMIREGAPVASAYEYVWQQGDMTMRPFSFQRSTALTLEVSWGENNFELGSGRERLTLGRSNDNDLVIDEHYVSRHHAEIIVRGDKFYLLDRSTNGTMVKADGGDMLVVRREELVLSGVGAIHLGSQSTTAVRYRARGGV